MEIVNFPEIAYSQVGATGDCPHCSTPSSYFRPLGNAVNQYARVANICQCEPCKEFVLVVGQRTNQGSPATLIAVYPLGKPNDAVAKEVVETAKAVADDFSEALRCQWIKAYKGCVVLCRRAIQASALALGAPKNKKLD